MKIPLTFNSLLWLANARRRLAFWLRTQRETARDYKALRCAVPADISGIQATAVRYWRNEVHVCRQWFAEAAVRHGFGI